jgi:aspartate racemase
MIEFKKNHHSSFIIHHSSFIVHRFFMKTKTLGIVGGLGPDATALFYVNLVNTMLQGNAVQPCILIHNVPATLTLCRKMSHNHLAESDKTELYLLLRNACKALEAAGVDFITIPCNTAHLFIDQLRQVCATPIISIIDATQAAIPATMKKVAILATRTTIDHGLYQKSLLKNGMIPILVDDATQNRLSQTILNVVQTLHTDEDRDFMKKIVQNLRKRGCDAIILGCTELPLIVESDETIISSLVALKKAAVQSLMQPAAERARLQVV